MSFSTLSLSEPLLAALPSDIKTPTEIQSLTIPKLLAKRNLLALANTGSGKTLAFGLPMIERLMSREAKQSGEQGLVLVPTRELALQVTESLNRVAKPLGLHAVCLCGGVDKSLQQAALEQNPAILVATTGRLLDLVNDETLVNDESFINNETSDGNETRAASIDLSRISFLVLDEADRLLDMGFWNDVQTIAERTPSSRQTAMFSATFSETLKQKAALIMPNASKVAAHQANSTNQNVQETLYLVNKGSKTKALIELIQQNQWQQVLVFIGAKENADGLSKKLNKAGIQAVALHGDKSQAERETALAAFKSGQAHVLIATDLLARGIHIEQLPVVINFELPSHSEVYVHRVGRTARAGQQGVALSLVCHGEMPALEAIRTLTQRALPVQDLAGFPVTDTPSTGESKRAPRDKKANRRTQGKKSIKQFQGKQAGKPSGRSSSDRKPAGKSQPRANKSNVNK